MGFAKPDDDFDNVTEFHYPESKSLLRCFGRQIETYGPWYEKPLPDHLDRFVTRPEQAQAKLAGGGGALTWTIFGLGAGFAICAVGTWLLFRWLKAEGSK